MEDLPVTAYALMESISEEIPEGHFIASDPILQYLAETRDADLNKLIVAKDCKPLRTIYATINGVGQEECLLDNGSMIVSMSKEVATQLGLTWDPLITIDMESASNHVERTLGIARNAKFTLGGLNFFLQVHILEHPPYRVLLGRPFDTLVRLITRTNDNGSSEVVLTDPNTKKVTVIPTYPRGKGPEELQKSKFPGF